MLFGPDRAEDHHHFGLVSAINRHPANLGKRIVTQSIDPLLTMLDVLPSWQPSNVHLLGHFLKRGDLVRSIKARVQPLLGHTAKLQRPLMGLVQRHDVCPTQSKVGAQRRALLVLLTFDHNARDLAPRARWINHQIKATAIPVTPSAEVRDQLLCQLSR